MGKADPEEPLTDDRFGLPQLPYLDKLGSSTIARRTTSILTCTLAPGQSIVATSPLRVITGFGNCAFLGTPWRYPQMRPSLDFSCGKMRHRYSDFSSSETTTVSSVSGRVTRETLCSKLHEARTNIARMMNFSFIGRTHDQDLRISFPSSRDKGYRI